MSTFIKLGAQSMSERNAAIKLMFPVGSMWSFRGQTYRVRSHNVHGSILMDHPPDGMFFKWWPHEMKIAEWSAVTKDDQS